MTHYTFFPSLSFEKKKKIFFNLQNELKIENKKKSQLLAKFFLFYSQINLQNAKPNKNKILIIICGKKKIINKMFENISNISNFSRVPGPHYEMTLDLILYGTVFYTFIFIIGVTGNFLVLYVIMKEKALRNFTNYLLANLSVADLMVLITCVPSGIHDLFGILFSRISLFFLQNFFLKNISL